MVADEHHFDLVVVALEEQVQKDEKAFGDVLGGLGHGAGNVHQAEHHSFRTGVGLLDQQVVLEVEGVEEGQAVDACLEPFDFLLDFLDVGEVVRFLDLQAVEFFLRFAQQGTAAAGQGNTPGMGRTQGTNDVDA
ncbi:hypothetical protein D3C79_841180 [compost metagenome]